MIDVSGGNGRERMLKRILTLAVVVKACHAYFVSEGGVMAKSMVRKKKKGKERRKDL
jgi:hypothetical protein